jgi:hypothetical protein
MKKIALLLLITLIATTASAQMRPGSTIGKLRIRWYKTGWFLDANAGIRLLGQSSDIATMNIGPSFNAGIGYFFNDKIALKGRIDYNQFATAYGNVLDKSASLSASAEVMVRLLQVFANKRSRHFSLNLHAGVGLTSLRNPSYIDFREDLGPEYDDHFIKNQDDMGHIIVGLTPQYHFNSRLSINLDISHFTQFKQNTTYDTHNAVKANNVTGIISTSIGLTFRP